MRKALIIETAQLEIVCQKIIEKLKQLPVDRVEVEQDFYWELTNRQAYADNLVLGEQTLGSHVDDWMELQNVVSGKHPTTFVDFDRVAAILKAVSQELNPE